jgi:hypothetical protein
VIDVARAAQQAQRRAHRRARDAEARGEALLAQRRVGGHRLGADQLGDLAGELELQGAGSLVHGFLGYCIL